MALRSTLIWSTTPLSKIFSSFWTKSKLRNSITPDTYVSDTPTMGKDSHSQSFLLSVICPTLSSNEVLCSVCHARKKKKRSTKNWPLSLYTNSQSEPDKKVRYNDLKF